MADEIKQTLGFDASDALNALHDLDNAFKSVNGSLSNFADAMRKFNSGASATVSATNSLGSAYANTSKKIDQFGVSLGLIGRIITTQTTVRAMSRTIVTMEDSIDAAIKFQTKLSEIQTISPNSNLADLSKEVRELSDSFNISALDIASAKYEALSNGFVKAADNADVLNASIKFSKVALTDSGKSLDLISTVLNAYGKNASEAESISAKLFKTVELGKTTGTELAASLGRVTPVAAQLGVSIDEVLAQFAALTIAGVNSSEAATQVSATLSALIKPSVAAQDAFKKLGFSSAETSIATLGLQGTLKSLISTTDGSAASIAKIFPNIRSLRDVLRVVPNDDKLTGFLKEIQNIDTSKFNDILGKRLATDAERVTSEVNKLKNLLTVDLGQALLSSAASASKFIGGVDGIIATMNDLAPILSVGTGLLAVYSAAALTGAKNNAIFANSFSKIAGLSLLASEAVTIGNVIGNKISGAAKNGRDEFDKIANEVLANMRKSESERLKLQQDFDAKRLDSVNLTIQNLNKVYLEDVSNAQNAGRQLEKNSTRVTESIINDRERLQKQIEKSTRETEDLQRDSANRVENLMRRADDRQFTRSNVGTDVQQASRLAQRAQDLADDAAKKLQSAAQLGDKEAISRAISLFNEAQNLGEQAASIGKRAGNRALEAKAAAGLEEITERQIQAERQLQSIQDERKTQLDALNKKQLEALDTVRQQAAIIRDNSSVLDSSGQIKSASELAKQTANVQAALQKIQDTGLSEGDLKLFDAAGLGQQARQFQIELQKQSLQLNFDVLGGVQRIQSELQASFQKFKLSLNFDIGNLEGALGKVFNSPEEVARGLTDVRSEADKLRQSFSQLTVSEADFKRLRIELASIADSLDNASRSFGRGIGLGTTGEELKQGIQLVNQLKSQLQSLTNDADLTDKEITDFFTNVAKLGDLAGSNPGFNLDVQELATAAALLKQIQAIQQQNASNPALNGGEAKLKMLESIINGLPTEKFNTIAANIGNGVQPSKEIADNFVRAADAAERLSIATQSTQNKALGGSIAAFATGGRATGTDTVPAMLTPGEFVVNKNSSQKFFSELQAINAGIAPAMRDPSSIQNVTNNIGDIVINESATPDLTAKAIDNIIRRGSRRGII